MNEHHTLHNPSLYQQRLIEHRRQSSKHQREYDNKLRSVNERLRRHNSISPLKGREYPDVCYSTRDHRGAAAAKNTNNSANNNNNNKMSMVYHEDPPLEMNSSLNDSFGWDDDDDDASQDQKRNAEFERLYRDDDVESSLFGNLDMNITTEKKKPWQQMNIHRTTFAYKGQLRHHCNNTNYHEGGEDGTAFTGGLNPYEETLRGKSTNTNTNTAAASSGGSKHNRGSIFRKTQTKALPSPHTLDAARQRDKTLKTVPTPNESIFTSSTIAAPTNTTQRQPTRGILRNSTTAATASSNNQRSLSRSRPSRSRSRSRYYTQEDESLFRGAQLIKEQLIRSMDSVDRERDGGGRNVSFHQEEEDDDNMDYDYSRSNHNTSSLLQSNSSMQTDPSSIQSRLESESQRLDAMIKMFAQTNTGSSMSSSTHNTTTMPSTTDNLTREERDAVRLPEGNKAVSSPSPKEEECSTASPKSTCVDDLNKVAANTGASTKSYYKQSSQDSFPEHQGMYAKQYLQDTSKPNTDASTVLYTDSPMISSSKQIMSSHPTIQETPSQQDLQAQYARQKQLQSRNQCNDALSHAQSAGSLWRSLVSNHVRFPQAWEDVLPPSAPPLERPGYKWSKWYYVARHRVKGDFKLNSKEYGVRSRRSGGRILMNVLVREMHTPMVSREIAVGCYHPNARGIRSGDPLKQVEDVREVWMSVRWVIPENAKEPELNEYCEEDVECFIDGFLTQRRRVLDYQTMGSPLGHRKAVNNENVRAVFGDTPPLRTVNLYEDELAEIIKANDVKKIAGLPGLMLLKLFLFSK